MPQCKFFQPGKSCNQGLDYELMTGPGDRLPCHVPGLPCNERQYLSGGETAYMVRGEWFGPDGKKIEARR